MLAGQLIECVPNFSEGRDQKKIESIADAIRSVENVQLLHIDSGYDANRTVYTLVGEPSAIVTAIVEAFRTAKQLCNMVNHLGTHPRIGLLDVCPLIPLRNISISETCVYATSLADKLAEAYNQTIYLYEQSATVPRRKNLAHIRRGEYEGLKRKLAKPEWMPDYGSSDFLSQTGATIIGVRPFLIAFNVNPQYRECSYCTNHSSENQDIWISERAQPRWSKGTNTRNASFSQSDRLVCQGISVCSSLHEHHRLHKCRHARSS